MFHIHDKDKLFWTEKMWSPNPSLFQFNFTAHVVPHILQWPRKHLNAWGLSPGDLFLASGTEATQFRQSTPGVRLFLAWELCSVLFSVLLTTPGFICIVFPFGSQSKGLRQQFGHMNHPNVRLLPFAAKSRSSPTLLFRLLSVLATILCVIRSPFVWPAGPAATLLESNPRSLGL